MLAVGSVDCALRLCCKSWLPTHTAPRSTDLDHSSWRSFKSDKRNMDAMRNFVDGDLVESFLDLKPELMEQVCVASVH